MAKSGGVSRMAMMSSLRGARFLDHMAALKDRPTGKKKRRKLGPREARPSWSGQTTKFGRSGKIIQIQELPGRKGLWALHATKGWRRVTAFGVPGWIIRPALAV